MQAVQYSPSHSKEWDEFLDIAVNSLFMFKRRYMEYHSDRFVDNSLMFYDEDSLVAVMPASIDGQVLVSHGGLTYGGFIFGKSMKQSHMNEVTECLIGYMKENHLKTLIYKEVPLIYHSIPAEECEYSLFWRGAFLKKMECSSVVDLKNRIKFPKGRKAQVSRAKREGVEVVTSTDFRAFIDLENEVLKEYHNAKAVHTGQELELLHDRFPDNIRLVAGMYQGKIIAGALLFVYDNVVKTQYLAANDKGREIGALDLVISTALDEYSETKKWFDFGKSTEGDGDILNEGLISQKEGFGGRTVMYKTWQLDI